MNALKGLLLLLAGSAMGYAYADLKAEALRQDLALEQETSRGLLERVGAACEPVYQAAWVSYACPGIFPVPAALRPLACLPKVEVYRSAALEQVREKVSATSPGSAVLVLEEKGARERKLALTWRPELGR